MTTLNGLETLPDELHHSAEAVQTVPTHLWPQFLTWVCTTENDRRKKSEAQSEGKAELVKELREQGVIDTVATAPETATKITDFHAWVNPGTDHTKMYLRGDKVSHKGKIWESQVNGLNSWEPGGAGVYDFIWRDVTHEALPTREGEDTPPLEDVPPAQPPADTPPAFTQPTGGHDAYKIGDRVLFNGEVWESVINANVWSPATYSQGWKKVV